MKKAILYSAGAAALLAGGMYTVYSSGLLGEIAAKVDRKEEIPLLSKPVALFVSSQSLPSLEETLEKAYQQRGKSSFNLNIYDRNEQLIYSERNLSRTVPATEISPSAGIALQAAEDRYFYQHRGWNVAAAAKAVGEHLFSDKRLRGASTISIQLADFLLPDDSDKWKNKIKEWVFATEIEHVFSKEQILTHYLNLAPFGHADTLNRPIFGIEAAAQYYFNKPAKELNLLESVALMATLQKNNFATKAYRGFQSREVQSREEKFQQRLGSVKYYEELVELSKVILERVKGLEELQGKKLVSHEEYFATLKLLNQGEIHFRENRKCYGPGFDYCEYVQLVLERVNDLHQKFGLQEERNYDIYTYFNPELQQQARETFLKHLQQLRSQFAKSQQEKINGSVVVLDLKTLGLEAIVGGPGINAQDFPSDYLNRAVLRYAPIGSAFKPFVLAAALSDGKTLQSTMLDIPREFIVNNRKYSPANYRGNYTGREMSLLEATITSNNSIYSGLADELRREKGKEYLIGMFNRFGFNFTDFMLSYSIGTKELSLLEVAAAYTPFADGGKSYQFSEGSRNARTIRKIVTDNAVWENVPREETSISPLVAKDVDYALWKVVEEGTGRKARFPGLEVRGKTGSGRASISFIGYEPRLQKLVGVLFASEDHRTIDSFPSSITGGSYAAPLFSEIIRYIREQKLLY